MEPGQLSALQTADDGTNYMLYFPTKYVQGGDAKHPLLLFLHGAGGVQNEGNVKGQSLGRMLVEQGAEFMKEISFPFILIVPVAGQRGWQPQFESLMGLVDMAQKDLGADVSTARGRMGFLNN